MEAQTLDDARARGVELLDRAEREKAAQARAARVRFATRATAIVAGARRTLDVAETPSPGGFVGIAVDVTELEEVKADLQRQMQAHGAHPRPPAQRGGDLRRPPPARVPQRRLPRALGPRSRVPRERPERKARSSTGCAPSGGFPSRPTGAAGRPTSSRPTAPSSPRRAGGTFPTGARSTSWPTRARRGGSPISRTSSTTSPSTISLESRYNALMRVQGETLDALEKASPCSARTGGPQARQPRLPARSGALPDPAPGEGKSALVSVRQASAALAPDEEAWEQVRPRPLPAMPEDRVERPYAARPTRRRPPL